MGGLPRRGRARCWRSRCPPRGSGRGRTTRRGDGRARAGRRRAGAGTRRAGRDWRRRTRRPATRDRSLAATPPASPSSTSSVVRRAVPHVGALKRRGRRAAPCRTAGAGTPCRCRDRRTGPRRRRRRDDRGARHHPEVHRLAAPRVDVARVLQRMLGVGGVHAARRVRCGFPWSPCVKTSQSGHGSSPRRRSLGAASRLRLAPSRRLRRRGGASPHAPRGLAHPGALVVRRVARREPFLVARTVAADHLARTPSQSISPNSQFSVSSS